MGPGMVHLLAGGGGKIPGTRIFFSKLAIVNYSPVSRSSWEPMPRGGGTTLSIHRHVGFCRPSRRTLHASDWRLPSREALARGWNSLTVLAHFSATT